MSKFLNISIPIILCLIVGFFGSLVQGDALENWYPYLVKSPVTPPNIVFPIAWTILYILMGLSMGILLNRGGRGLIPLWSAQLKIGVPHV